MKSLFIFLTLALFSLDTSGSCRGCCSGHRGVVCENGVTQCRDGTALSQTCQSKGCNKCGGAKEKSSPSDNSSQVADEYDRDLYNYGIDKDGDCQDTRAEILIRYNQGDLGFETDRKCRVVWGKWVDPYSGRTFHDASHLHIDHIIPLKTAHELGARDWSAEKKEKFANDPINLLPVWKKLNVKKGAKGIGEWVPPNKAYSCQYLEQWESISKEYGLDIQKRSLASTSGKLDHCE